MPDAESYKLRKEAFVSNLSGGSVSEISYVTSIAPVAMFLWSILQARQSFFKPYSVYGLAVDFFINVGAILLATTLYSGAPLLLDLLILGPAFAVWLLPSTPGPRGKRHKLPPRADSRAASAPLAPLSIKPFITTYRGCMMIVTCVAILAVDFRLFPRRFAKVETWGTSLMDMGVGAFVFSAGVVASRQVLKEKLSGKRVALSSRLLKSLRHSIPLLVLGFIRLLSVKGLDYAEHVSEYGVHWNFFFTLGFLPPFVALFEAAFRLIPSHAAMAMLLSGIYQISLETTNLKAFILTAPRIDLLTKNREGVFSFIGYLSIFLAGQDLGKFIIPRYITASAKSNPGMQRNTLLMTIGVWASIWTGLYLISTSFRFGFALSVSRRLANLPYVLWVVSFNCWQVLAFCVIDTIFFPGFYNATDDTSEREAYDDATSPVLRAFNRNGLAVFLVANLLTGLVNMTVPTLDVAPVVTIGILLGYLATVTGIALVLDKLNITIRL